MNDKVSRAVIWRLGLALAGLLFASACGSTGGCAGCNTETIPGGFPQEHRLDNAMQVRLSQSGVGFMEQNFDKLVNTMVPGGLNFDIPPTGCSSDQRVCCSGPPCKLDMNITSVTITPTPKSTAKLDLRAQVKTVNPIKFEQKVLFAWISCDVNFDSTKSGNSTLGLVADIDLVVDANDNNKLKVTRGSSALQDFDDGDISISGGVTCTIIDWVKSLFMGTIKDQMMSTVDDTLDGMLKDLPMGQEGRFDVASFMQAYSPGTSGVMDYFLWAGGYAEAQSQGMSVGVMGGFRAAQHNPCVPDCEAPGASCQPPQKVAISRSPSFSGNTRADGTPFHVGIGVHKNALDWAGYALYSSGGICLDITTQTVDQLSSGMFGILVPSLNALTGGDNLPMLLAIRPRHPPTFELGKGTFHKDKNGNPVIDEPLLTIKAKKFTVDIYVLLDERFMRIFTVIGDLEIPALLFPDSEGKLQIILGDLNKALTNITVENSDLITEDPTKLATLFPTIMGLAASFLAGGFQAIELPSLQGLKLQLGDGSITSVDNNQLLAIYADLALEQTTSGTLPGLPGGQGKAETKITVDRVEIPPTAAFRVGSGLEPATGPAVILDLAATLPEGLAGKPVEYTIRVDGGFFRPFTSADRVTVRDPLLWLQGRHTIEVAARVVGQPRSLDPTPASVQVVIDTVPPRIELVPTESGVRAEVIDLVTPPDEVALSWSVDGKPFGGFSRGQRSLTLPRGTSVSVKARDEAGNVGLSGVVLAGVVLADPETEEAAGCSLAAHPGAPALGLLLLVAAGIGLLSLRRRRPRR